MVARYGNQIPIDIMLLSPAKRKYTQSFFAIIRR